MTQKYREHEGPYFGEYGGRWMPESLVAALDELEETFRAAKEDPSFAAEFERLSRDYTGRPSLLTEVPRFAAEVSGVGDGGARIFLKREDLNHTGSHKINNVLGQALIARRMGKTRLIAETGAGQHGVATATAAALMGMECVVYMGAEDTRRQALNVARMNLLGAEVVPVDHGAQTSRTPSMRRCGIGWPRWRPPTMCWALSPGRIPSRRWSATSTRSSVRRPASRSSSRPAACPTPSRPAWAEAPTPWASSTASWTTSPWPSTAMRPGEREWIPVATPRRSRWAAPGCSTAPAPT